MIWSVRARLPLRIVTLLVPLRGTDQAAPAVSLVPGPDGAPAGIILGPEDERILFEDEALLAS